VKKVKKPVVGFFYHLSCSKTWKETDFKIEEKTSNEINEVVVIL